MVLHNFKIAIEGSISEQANYGSLAKAMEGYLIVAVVTALPIAIWTSTSLLIAVQGRFPEVNS